MEQVRAAYGALAERYIDLFGTTATVDADDLALIVRHLSIRPGAVLDAGCGPGHLTAHLRSLGVDASGIDPVPGFIDHARRCWPDARFELGSFDPVPVADGSLAGILAWYSLIHVPPHDLGTVVAGLRRALTRGGTLVVGFFEGDEVVAFDHKVTTAWYWPADELSGMLQRAGFTEVERLVRPADPGAGIRSQAAIAATAD